MPEPFAFAGPGSDLAVRPLDLRPPLEADSRGLRPFLSVGANFVPWRPKGCMTDDPPATILVAEDDATTRTFLADELTADGCELLTADTARDALRLIETRFPDLAVLDVGLPDGS